jgi:hypothetical protein
MLGQYVSSHPLTVVRDQIRGYQAPNQVRPVPVTKALALPDGSKVATLGVVTEVQHHVAKATGKPWAELLLQGTAGEISVKLFGKSYARLVESGGAHLLTTGTIVIAHGRVSTEEPVDNGDDDDTEALDELPRQLIADGLIAVPVHDVPAAGPRKGPWLALGTFGTLEPTLDALALVPDLMDRWAAQRSSARAGEPKLCPGARGGGVAIVPLRAGQTQTDAQRIAAETHPDLFPATTEEVAA